MTEPTTDRMCMDCGKLASEGAEFTRASTWPHVISPFCQDCGHQRTNPLRLPRRDERRLIQFREE